MTQVTSKRKAIRAALVLGAATLLVILLPTIALALPAYATATGQPCSTCHVNPAGGGTLTAKGSAFAAIPTHATNAAAAWAQVNAPAAAPAPATAAPAPAAPAAPAATPRPAAPAATPAPGTLPTTGDAPEPSTLPMALTLAAIGIGALGLSLRRASVRGR